jgi:hypothetical protein
MICVACLDKQWFAAMLDGIKHVEWRERKRPDPRIANAVSGERVVFLERGTTRAIIREIELVESVESDGKILYAINLKPSVRLFQTRAVHLQGWHRRERLKLK